MPFRFWLWPLPTSVVISGGPSASPRLVSLVLRPNHRSNTGHARTRLCHRTIHYVHPYLFVFASAPIPKFRCSMSPQCVSILRGLDRLPDLETKSLAVSCRQTHRAAPCSPTPYERFGFVRACGCSPGFSVASSFRRRSRPLPRRPMTSAAFPIRRTFHRRVLLPQCFAFRLTPPRASSRLRGHPPEELARFQRRPSPAHPTAVSPAAFAFRRHRDSARWRLLVEIPVHARLETGASCARFFGPSGHRLPRSAAAWGRLCPSTSVTKLSNVGSRSTGAIHARHNDPCGVARTS